MHTIIIPCLFGLEGLVLDELRRLGIETAKGDTGRVTFEGEIRDLIRANINIRTGERVLLLLGEFEAGSFDDLFEGVKAICWEDYLPDDAAFPVKGYSIDSILRSVPDCQSIIKKAVVDRMSVKYGNKRFPESGAMYQIRFSIMKNKVQIYLDSSGISLHKRGYRPNANVAPLRETLAAAIVILSRYRGREVFFDPFCGSGTIAIEAALAAKNRAPGIARYFAAEKWSFIGNNLWDDARNEAISREFSGDYRIHASDIDASVVELAKENAKRAGIADIIHFSVADALKLTLPDERSILAANPPYGERLLDINEAEKLYRNMGKAFSKRDNLSLYVLSSDPDFEKHFGQEAKKRRKLYNGMIKCQLFMYF